MDAENECTVCNQPLIDGYCDDCETVLPREDRYLRLQAEVRANKARWENVL